MENFFYRARNSKWSVLVYAIILSIFAASVAYMIFSKSEILMTNLSYQTYNSKLNKNIEDRARIALDYDIYLNTNGSGLTNTRSCPGSVTMSGTTMSGTIEMIDTVPYYDGTTFFCSGSTASGSLALFYSSDFTTFSTGIFTNTLPLNPPGGTGTLSAVFSDPQAKAMSFIVPITTSGLDADFNSDEYTVFSTGIIRYPNGYTDDDVLARKTIFGYVRKGGGWYNIFWNNALTNAFIEKNTNNRDTYNVTIGKTWTGYLYLDIDNPYSIRVMEFSSGTYADTGELKKMSDLKYTSSTGGIGYIQNDGSLGGTGASVKSFDFQNRNYAVFLSYSGNLNNTGAVFLKYKMTGMNNVGSGIYLTPIDDSSPTLIEYLGNDIIIDNENNYLSKQSEVTALKPWMISWWANSLDILNCFIGSNIWCLVY